MMAISCATVRAFDSMTRSVKAWRNEVCRKISAPEMNQRWLNGQSSSIPRGGLQSVASQSSSRCEAYASA